jgi:hypothetical protein
MTNLRSRRLHRSFRLACFLIVFCVWPEFAKDTPPQVIVWPNTGTPIVRFTFGKLKQLANVHG